MEKAKRRRFFRVWETDGFSELCRRRIRHDRMVINLSFCDGSSSQFIVFFADFSESVFLIEEDEASPQLFLRQGWDHSVHGQTLNDWDLSKAEMVHLISDDETQRTFVHCAELSGEGIVLSITTREQRMWKRLLFAEYLGSDFVYSQSQFKNDALLVIGKKQLSSSAANCTALFCEISSHETEFPVSFLKGADGRFTRDGAFVVTWDGTRSDGGKGTQNVYIYDMEENTGHFQDLEVLRDAHFAERTPRVSICLEDYDALSGTDVFHAELLHGKKVGSSSDQFSSRGLFWMAKLILFLSLPESGTVKIVVVGLEDKVIDFQFDVSAPCLHFMAQQQSKRFFCGQGFSFSPNGQQLYLQDSVYSLADGKELCRIDEYSAGMGNAVHAEFDPLGRSILISDGKKIQIFAAPQPAEFNGWSKFTSDLTESSMYVLRFMERYDSVAFGRLMSDGFSLKRRLIPEVSSLVENDVFAGINRILQSHAATTVSHVVLSSDRTLMAIVLQDTQYKISLYRTEDPSNSFYCFTQWKTVLLPDVASSTASDDPSFGLFCSAGEHKEFGFVRPQCDGIYIARVSLAQPEQPVVQWIESRTGASLRKMKVTEDASKAFAIFEDWEFLVLSLDDGIRIVSGGYLHYPCRIDFFVGFFIESSFIHLSHDNRRLSVGWDSSLNKLVSFVLNLSREDMLADYARNCCHLQGSNFEWLLWINCDHSRAVVHKNEHGSSHLVVYDISQRPAKERRTFVASTDPLKPGEWSYAHPPHPAWNRLSHIAHMHLLCVQLLLDLRLTVPDAALFDVLAIELDTVITERLISDFGRALVERQQRGNKTLLHHAVIQRQHDCAKLLLSFAASHGITLSLCWEGGDLLGWAIAQESRESVEFVMEMVARRCTTVTETASILSVHLDRLLELFPRLLCDYFVEDKLCFEYGRFSVPLSLLKNWEERPVAMVTAPMSDWTAASSEETRAFWKRNEKSFMRRLEKGESEVQTTVISKFVCLEEMVYQRKGNFIMNLNRDTVPVDIFNASFVRALVQWRWHTSLRNGFLLSAVLHVIAALTYSMCLSNAEILRVGLDEAGECVGDCIVVKERPFIQWTAAITVFLVIYLTMFGIIPPTRIVSFFTVPSILLYLAITGRHHRYEFVAVIAAVECMFFWSSIMFYLQPLSATGPLVSMIKYVFKDIMAFVILGALVIIGFGFAFLVLFSDVFGIEDYGLFSTPLRSFETLFYASLGEFDAEPFRSSGGHLMGVCRSLLFDGFLFVAGIVMLSLLIAVLGDTYDRVKLTEEAELIKCRAKLVAIGYGWNGLPGKILRSCARWLLGAKPPPQPVNGPAIMQHVSGISVRPIQRCFHFLVPAEGIGSNRVATWHGKILELVMLIRSELRKNEAKLATGTEAAEKQVHEMRKDMATLIEKTDQRALQNERLITQLEGTLAQISQRLNQEH